MVQIVEYLGNIKADPENFRNFEKFLTKVLGKFWSNNYFLYTLVFMISRVKLRV